MNAGKCFVSTIFLGVVTLGAGNVALAEHEKEVPNLLSFGRNASMSVPWANRPETYQFKVEETQRIIISSTSFPGPEYRLIDTEAVLLDGSGNRIAEDDNSGEFSHFRIEEVLEPGVYTLKVAADGPLPRSEYRLRYSITLDHA